MSENGRSFLLISVVVAVLGVRALAQGPAPAPVTSPAVAPPSGAPASSPVSLPGTGAAPSTQTPPQAQQAVPTPQSVAQPAPPQGAAAPNAAADKVSAQELLNELQNTDDPYTTTLLQTRDPFNPPPIVAEAAIEKTELEQVPLEQIKITGIITGLSQQKAILVTPNGKTHIVGERTKIGTRKGIVKKITANSIVVRERFANVFGKEENIDTEIKIVEKKERR